MDEKILITGGAGYIGSHFVYFLINEMNINPSDIVIIDNLKNGNKELIPKGCCLYVRDLKGYLNDIFEDHKISKVFHFAAYAYVGESMSDPHKYFSNNIGAGVNLLETMKKFNCKNIVFSSTCAVYGLPETEKISESSNLRPINPYGESKLMFEKILQWYDKLFNIKYVSLRYFNAAGAAFGIGEKHEPETHIIPLLLSNAINKEKVFHIFGDNYSTKDGTCVRDYIHVFDLANAHWKVMNYLIENNKSDVFNLGTSSGYTIKEIIKIIEEVTGNKIEYSIEKPREGDPPILVSNYSKIKKEIGWEPKRDIKDIISDAWEWHKKNEN